MALSSFDLAAFEKLVSGDDARNQIVAMARTAEAAERYDDMTKFMKWLVKVVVEKGSTLTVEERNLLSVAYKNVIGSRRASWRTLHAELSQDGQAGQEFESILQEYKSQVEKELKSTCDDILDLLKNKLINSCADSDGDPKVFYLKMTADYYRYLAESVTDQGHDRHCAEYYEKAYKIAEVQLKPTHPIRLGLALNYSVCHYEILKDQESACKLAKKAFDDAISKLDKLEEADYKDSTLIMQLLRDNLTLWTSDADNNGDEQVQVEDLSDEEN
jgi:hypothetical protein